MGTTRDMLEAGSSNYVYIVAIEGYPYLLHNHSSSAAVLTAWSGADWSQALGGLSVDLKLTQSLSPDEPFGEMGTCTLWVQAIDGDDSFGVATHKRIAAAETKMSASVDRNDTTVTVLSTAAFASSGEIHIGTECIAYSGKTSTTFTGCSRGMYSPFATAFSSRFPRDHTVRTDSNSVSLQPRVTSTPVAWKGRFVGVYAHRVVGGVLDTKEQAEIVFAGTIGDVRDDRNTGCTAVEVRSIMEWISSRVLGEGMLEAVASDGMYLSEGMTIEFVEKTTTGGTTTTGGSSTPLEVVASGATGVYEINAGRYSVTDICSYMNAWLAASSTTGTYSISSPVTIPGGQRTKVYYQVTADTGYFFFKMPAGLAEFFGFSEAYGAPLEPGYVVLRNEMETDGGANVYYDRATEPLRTQVDFNGSSLTSRMGIESTTGVLVDQYARLPASIKPSTAVLDGVTHYWGLFIAGDSAPLLAAWDPADETELVALREWKIGGSVLGAAIGLVAGAVQSASLKVGVSEAPVRVRQMYAYEFDLSTLLLTLFASTGTSGHNSVFDSLPRQLSVGVPEELLGVDMVTEVPNNGDTCVLVLDKPTRVSDLIKSDLNIRWAFPVWQDSSIRFRTWRAPSLLDSVADVDDTTKAEPSGVVASHAASSAQSDEWMRSIVKIKFNRQFANPDDDSYSSVVTFYDRAAVEDQGGAVKVHTYELANTYEEFAGTGASLVSLTSQYLAKMPLLSRPAWVVERSISPAMYWQLSIGDIVSFSDPFARDPATGTRGISNRPALVTHLSLFPGGTVPSANGAPTQLPLGARMRLFFSDSDTTLTGALYVPSANIDSTVSTGGFSAGYNSSTTTIRCEEHAYTNAAEAADASYFDIASAELIILERDPADPTTPLEWRRTLSSRSGNDLILTSALSSPAWDPTKKYVVLFADYADVTTAQLTRTFQAESATGLLSGSAQPYQYGSGSADPGVDANDSTAPELPADRIFSDASGRCIYGDTQAIRLADNYIDYNAQQRDSYVFGSTVTNSDAATGSGYKLVAFWPVFLNYEGLTSIYRLITCAVWAASTDGTSTKVRVRLRTTCPGDNTLIDIDGGSSFATAEWTGITSTTMTTLADVTTLAVNVKNNFFAGDQAGIAYVTLELGYKAKTRGIVKWQVGPRLS